MMGCEFSLRLFFLSLLPTLSALLVLLLLPTLLQRSCQTSLHHPRSLLIHAYICTSPGNTKWVEEAHTLLRLMKHNEAYKGHMRVILTCLVVFSSLKLPKLCHIFFLHPPSQPSHSTLLLQLIHLSSSSLRPKDGLSTWK